MGPASNSRHVLGSESGARIGLPHIVTVPVIKLRRFYHGPCTMVPSCAPTQATEDLLAFTIRHTSGVICASLEEERLEVRDVDYSHRFN